MRQSVSAYWSAAAVVCSWGKACSSATVYRLAAAYRSVEEYRSALEEAYSSDTECRLAAAYRSAVAYTLMSGAASPLAVAYQLAPG